MLSLTTQKLLKVHKPQFSKIIHIRENEQPVIEANARIPRPCSQEKKKMLRALQNC